MLQVQGVVLSICKTAILIFTRLGITDAPSNQITSIEIQVTWSKVKFKLLVFEQVLSAQYLLTPAILGTGDAPRY